MSDTPLHLKAVRSIDATRPGAEIALAPLLSPWFRREMLTGHCRYSLHTRRSTVIIDQIRAATVAADGTRWLDVVLAPARGIDPVPHRAITAPTERRGALVNAETIVKSASLGPSTCLDDDLRACDEGLGHVWAPRDDDAVNIEDCGLSLDQWALCPAGGITRMMGDLWCFAALVEAPRAEPEMLGFSRIHSIGLEKYGLVVELYMQPGPSDNAFRTPPDWHPHLSLADEYESILARDIVVAFEAGTS